MDKEYILFTMRDRIKTLQARYKHYLNGQDEYGAPLGYNTAAKYRSDTKLDLHKCMLVEELVSQIKTKEIPLTEEAENGLEKLMEPLERHRRLLEDLEL